MSSIGRKSLIIINLFFYLFFVSGCASLEKERKKQMLEKQAKEAYLEIEKTKIKSQSGWDDKNNTKIAGGVVGSIVLGGATYLIFKDELSKKSTISFDTMGLYIIGLFIVVGWMGGYELGGLIYDAANKK
jgi:tetrahydromethanopterin S-methyltransferase subunit D